MGRLVIETYNVAGMVAQASVGQTPLHRLRRIGGSIEKWYSSRLHNLAAELNEVGCLRRKVRRA